MTEAAPLEVQGVSLNFGGLKALSDVSFEVGPEEIVAIAGPNGAGKTALLNCMIGIYKPQQGRISFFGEQIVGRMPHRIARLGVARAFQHVELFGRMTVLDNLLLGRHVAMKPNLIWSAIRFGPGRRQEVEAREAVEEVIDFFELERFRKRTVADLPYGVQKLVGVARALCAEPKILLLDEPSSGLNRQEKEDLARFMLRIRAEQRIPIVWVEHDMELVVDLADRVLVMDFGIKVADGAPDEVVQDPRVLEAYLGKRAAERQEQTAGEAPS